MHVKKFSRDIRNKIYLYICLFVLQSETVRRSYSLMWMTVQARGMHALMARWCDAARCACALIAGCCSCMSQSHLHTPLIAAFDHAKTRPQHLQRSETSVLLHRSHRHGHSKFSRQSRYISSDKIYLIPICRRAEAYTYSPSFVYIYATVFAGSVHSDMNRVYRQFENVFSLWNLGNK